jgi:hypothetical protein
MKDDEVDAMSMLDVCEEAYKNFEQKRMNAQDLQRQYAIMAILQGEIPEEVAKRCGYRVDDSPLAAQTMDEVLRGMMMGSPGRPSEMQQFANWLCGYLHRQILSYDSEDGD